MKKKILAIDDEKSFLETLKDILEPEGYEVQTLSDPVKTEKYIKKFNPDLLILDVLMPVRSGFNVVEEFREKGLYQDLPKIFLTCLDDSVERMTAKACGVGKYIVKPFEPEKFIDIVNSFF